jgi:hypothetical protein
VGELVTMKASVNYVGKSMIIGIRVESENIQTGSISLQLFLFHDGLKRQGRNKMQEAIGLILSDFRRTASLYYSNKFCKKKRKTDTKKKLHSSKETLDSFEKYNVLVQIS